MMIYTNDRALHSAGKQPVLSRSPEVIPNEPTTDGFSSPMPVQWLSLILEEIDYGVLLLSHRQQILYSNHTARRELRQDHPLRIGEGRLLTARASDGSPLRDAIRSATQRGLRRLLVLNHNGKPRVVAVVPLPFMLDDVPVVLLLLGRRSLCESLSAQGFATCHGLTPAECNVLTALCEGQSPRLIASRHGVEVATIRTQIVSIRNKTGASSLRALLELVAQLPPLVGALRN
jgi:DNA-binding CsgD family transcriptional regulator